MKEGWKYKPLREVCEVINGLWKGKKPPYVKIGVIRNANFTKQLTLDFTNIEYINVEARQLEKKTLQKGDIIIEKSGGSEKWPVGRAVLFNGGCDENYSFSNFTAVLRIKNTSEVSSDFLYWYLYFIYFRGDTRNMQKAATGIHNIEFEKYLDILIPILPLEHQKEIVDRLNILYEEINQVKVNAISEIEEAYALYNAFLECSMIPKDGWKSVSLRDIATDMYRGSGIKRDQVTEKGIPCIRYGEIYTSYEISFSECKSHTIESSINPKKYFEQGDILFAITGESVEEIGKCIAYTGTERCLLGGDIIAMKHKQNAKFLSYALSTKNAIKQKGYGKTKLKVVHTNAEALKSIIINLPSIEEQTRIVTRLDSIYGRIQALKNNSDTLCRECDDLWHLYIGQEFE